MRNMIVTAVASFCMGVCVTASAQTNSPAANSAGKPVAASQADSRQLPPFLKPYYTQMFTVEGKPLSFVDHREQNNISHYAYSSDDQVINLSVESFACSNELCKTVYNNAIKYANEQATANAGQFRVVTDAEYSAEWKTGLGENYSFVFRLPTSLLFWTYTTRLDRRLPFDTYFDQIKSRVNRQRYEDALSAGNIEMGRWDPQIRDYARQLVKDGIKSEGLVVLRNLIATSPFDYEAQMDLVANTADNVAAMNSATAVLNNAENSELIAKASRLLGVREPSLSSLPLPDKNERGLQLILIPLGPSDIRLLREASQVYQTITNIPVKIARLDQEWKFGVPDRIPDQKAIQQAIVNKQGPLVDFTGWTRKRYESELLNTVASADAFSKFSTKTFVDKLEDRPGQYLADPYLDRLADMLTPYRSSDARTMYVGVTEANIFSGDTNYLFSLSKMNDGRTVSILSYSMMMAKTLGESYESRKRLVERIAKELVPASLKALDIPRPADPTDPYSYSNGVERLNEKTLVLSKPTKDALDKFR